MKACSPPVEDRRKAGHSFSQGDLIIAATALHHGLTVVFRDVSEHQKARAPVFNPWVEAPPAGTPRSPHFAFRTVRGVANPRKCRARGSAY